MYYYDEDDGFEPYRPKHIRLLESEYISRKYISDNSQTWIDNGLDKFEKMADRKEEAVEIQPNQNYTIPTVSGAISEEEKEVAIERGQTKAKMRELKNKYKEESERDSRDESLLESYSKEYNKLQAKLVMLCA